MHRIMLTMRMALLGALAPAMFVLTAHGQSILGPPSEANHFIETPKGWVHPKTPWGEPDIQANLNMMQAAGIPLERCANAARFGGPSCDMNKAWWTVEEHKQRIAAASGRGDPGRQLIQKGTDGRPPLESAHKHYMGDSRGHWEGNTLVVETSNYKGGLAPIINLAVLGSPAGNRFPQSDEMKTTERITRLNDEMWLYEIRTEDPVILTRPFTVRYPMRHDPKYEWWEYACHEGNVIVPNYVTTSRFERANPQAEPATPVQVEANVASALAGRWVGRPRIATIEYDIELEFTKSADGAIVGKLVGTTLPKEEKIDKPLKRFTVKERRLNWEFPNTQPWNFAGELSADGTAITGVISSIQGGIQVEFRKR